MNDGGPTEAEVRSALSDEGLTHWSWFESGYPRADECGIRRDGDGWVVYVSDERGGDDYRRHYDEEGSALADFLERTRSNTRWFRLRALREGS